MRNIAEEIKRVRKAMGWNQAELAEAIGASQGSVSKWERGLESPRSEMLIKIRGFYEVEEHSADAHSFMPGGKIEMIDIPLTGAMLQPSDEDLYSGQVKPLETLRLPKHSLIKGAVTAWAVPYNAHRVANFKPGQIIFTHQDNLQRPENGDKVMLRETIHNGKFVYYIAFYGSSDKGFEWFTLNPQDESTITLSAAIPVGEREKRGVFPVGVVFGSIAYESVRTRFWDKVEDDFFHQYSNTNF